MSEPLASSGKGMKLHTKILLGLLVGLILGITVNVTVGTEHPTVEALNDYIAVPIGQIFLRMLFMVVMPLVFASIALGVAGLGDIRRVGRIGAKAIGYFFITTVLAARRASGRASGMAVIEGLLASVLSDRLSPGRGRAVDDAGGNARRSCAGPVAPGIIVE